MPTMNRRSWICQAALATLVAFAPQDAEAQAILEPPFGLHWGDSPEQLLEWSNRHQLDLGISVPGGQPTLRVLRFKSAKGFLPGSQASELEARFFSGQLYEVTVIYSDPEATPDIMEARFLKLKRQLTTEYGELTANKQQRTVADQYATKSTSFHREPVQGLFLLLSMTEVEDMVRHQREVVFSLLYRNDNLRRRLEGEAGLRATKPQPDSSKQGITPPR